MSMGVAGTSGFAKGVIKGLVGGTAVALTGAVTGSEQLVKGVFAPCDLPGQGRGLVENWQHLVYTPTENIIQLKTPDTFHDELQELIADGIVPEINTDRLGRDVGHSYQFFVTNEPVNVISGFRDFQYNTGT